VLDTWLTTDKSLATTLLQYQISTFLYKSTMHSIEWCTRMMSTNFEPDGVVRKMLWMILCWSSLLLEWSQLFGQLCPRHAKETKFVHQTNHLEKSFQVIIRCIWCWTCPLWTIISSLFSLIIVRFWLISKQWVCLPAQTFLTSVLHTLDWGKHFSYSILYIMLM